MIENHIYLFQISTLRATAKHATLNSLHHTIEMYLFFIVPKLKTQTKLFSVSLSAGVFQ